MSELALAVRAMLDSRVGTYRDDKRGVCWLVPDKAMLALADALAASDQATDLSRQVPGDA